MRIDSNVMISVIIPTHNSERYIYECVKSVMDQTFKNLQIICIDSSVDRTINILKELQLEDNRIEIIQDENSSYGHKLNVGIDNAKGEFIAIVESDDYILPQMYEHMLMVDSFDKVDYIKCCGTNHFVDFKDERIFEPEYCMEAENNSNRIIDLEKERELAFINLPRIWTALYKKSFLIQKNIRFNETPGASFQDTSFTQLVAFCAKYCIYVKGAFYCYRNDNVGSSVKSKSKVLCVCDEYKYLEKKLREKGFYSEKVKNHVLKNKIKTYAWNIHRLDKDGVEQFKMFIRDELEQYTSEIISSFTEDELDAYKIVTDECALQEYDVGIQKRYQQWRQLLRFINQHKFVLIGYGEIGKNVFWLQDVLKQKFVVAIGDNNWRRLQNEENTDYIKSIDNIVVEFFDEHYLVANKCHNTEIVQQLRNLGIPKEHIFILEYNLSKIQILNECVDVNNS